MAAPTFIIPKKNGTVSFISIFRILNEELKRRPYPIPKIAQMLQELEKFAYANSRDLNMRYHTKRLHPDSQTLCSPCIFQDKMSDLMKHLDFVRTYIDDLLVISSGTLDDHLKKRNYFSNFYMIKG
jgi:hypothetical protein